MKDQRNGRRRAKTLSSPWRALGRVLLAMPYTVVFLPLQTVVLALDLRFARWLPRFFHRQWCRIFGIHVRVRGNISSHRPTLYVANHVSYLEIIVLSSILDAFFIAKSEIADWPILGLLARLERTLFVERRRRISPATTSRLTWSRALTPPKWRWRSEILSGLGCISTHPD